MLYLSRSTGPIQKKKKKRRRSVQSSTISERTTVRPGDSTIYTQLSVYIHMRVSTHSVGVGGLHTHTLLHTFRYLHLTRTLVYIIYLQAHMHPFNETNRRHIDASRHVYTYVNTRVCVQTYTCIQGLKALTIVQTQMLQEGSPALSLEPAGRHARTEAGKCARDTTAKLFPRKDSFCSLAFLLFPLLPAPHPSVGLDLFGHPPSSLVWSGLFGFFLTASRLLKRLLPPSQTPGEREKKNTQNVRTSVIA